MQMPAPNEIDQPTFLPELRDDLRLLEGAPSATGQPTWVIEDPVRQRFFQINEDVFQILSLWSAGTAESLSQAAAQRYGRAVGAHEIDEVIRFIFANALSDQSVGSSYEDFVAQLERSRRGVLTTAVHSYLFFKIPLFRPHRFLQATLPFARLLMNRAALLVVLIASAVGLYLVSRQWDGFVSSFMHFFSIEGMAVYGLSLILVKSLHELGHAYVAERFGVRVSSMGVAFLVMFPVLYTDVSDAWRLTSRRQRVLIDAAGIIVELALAGLAMMAWVFLPDGALKSCAFVIATTSLLLSLLVNLNPFMRFDGYHLLADAIGVPNLQNRSFEFAKWRLREALFNFGAPPPESMSDSLRRFLIVYAVSVWIYRFFLFLGIALLVYALFFKALGLALFVIEILWFIVLPICKEVLVWWDRRGELRWRRSNLTGVACLIACVALLFVPLRHSIAIPAIVGAREEVKIFPPVPARIVQIAVGDGDRVQAGTVMFELASPELEQRIQLARQRLKLAEARRARAAGDKSELSQLLVLQRQLIAERNALDGLLVERDRLRVRAPADGTMVDLSDHIHPGRMVRLSDPLAILRSSRERRAVGYVGDDHLDRIATGTVGRFVPDDPSLSSVDVTVERIGAGGVSSVDVPFLASVYGGPIAVEREGQGRLRPVSARYQVDLALEASPPEQVMRGLVVMPGERVMLATLLWRQVMKVLVREMSA